MVKNRKVGSLGDVLKNARAFSDLQKEYSELAEKHSVMVRKAIPKTFKDNGLNRKIKELKAEIGNFENGKWVSIDVLMQWRRDVDRAIVVVDSFIVENRRFMERLGEFEKVLGLPVKEAEK